MNTDVVSNASCNDGFGEQARQVGQEDVQNGITSCWLLVGLVKSKVVDFVEEGAADILGVTISHDTLVFPDYVRKS